MMRLFRMDVAIPSSQHVAAELQKRAIRGCEIYASLTDYKLPHFCHKCGRPYPWMEDRLQTAKELARRQVGA